MAHGRGSGKLRAVQRPATLLALLALGCAPDLGACDEAAARAVVYDPNGLPAYEGQALMIQSCGGGSFCHSEGIDAEQRRGAPVGLELDVRLASATPDVNEEALARLARSQAHAFFERETIWAQVEGGTMPPAGFAVGTPEFSRIPAGEREGPAIPSIESDAGRDIVRNWLACGAPVIERTVTRSDGNENTVGDTQPSVETTPVEPTWPAIYERIVRTSCAFSLCHDAETAAGALDMSSADGAYAALMGPAAGRLCGDGGGARVVPSDPGASLLMHKLTGNTGDGPVCGKRMPSAGNYLSEGRIESIRTWIQNGASRE